MSHNYDYLLKYIVVGNAGVGKSCLVLQFTDKRFQTDYKVTIGAEFGTRKVEIDKKTVKLHLWDTAGQEQFKSLTRSYYRNCVGALLVYDITDANSFKDIQKWLSEAQEHGDNLNFMLIGNKADLADKRKVTKYEAEEFAREHGMMFFETSAKTKINVDESFISFSKNILKLHNEGKITLKQDQFQGLNVEEPLPNYTKKKKCCQSS